MKKSMSLNMAFNVLYKLLNILFPLITSVYLSRVLGPKYIGQVSYARNIMQYFLIFASLGIPTYGMRRMARCREENEDQSKTFSELFWLNAISTCICSLVFTLLICIVDKFRVDLWLFLAVGLTLYMNVFNIDWFYFGKEEYGYITIRSIVIKVLSIVCIFLFIKTQSDYIIYALINSVAVTGNYLFNMWHLRKRVKLTVHDLNLSCHLKAILIMLVVLFATDLYNQVDVTMLGIWESDEEIGYYSNAIQIVRIVISITTAVSSTILPRMCLFHSQNETEKRNELYNKTMKLVVVLSFPAGLGLFGVARYLVLVLWGEQFIPSIEILRILTMLIPVITVSYLVGSVVLTSVDKEKILLLATVLGAIVNITGNAILIPKLGAVGAAFMSLLSEIVVFAVHAFFARKYVKTKLHFSYLFSVLVGLLLMYAWVFAVARFLTIAPLLVLLIQVLGGAALYFISLMIAKNEVIGMILIQVKQKLASLKRR